MSDEDVSLQNEQLLRAYRLCFHGAAGQTVLLDMMKFCKFRVPVENQMDEGKRRAFLRIMNFLNLEPHQLALLYKGMPVIQQGETSDA